MVHAAADGADEAEAAGEDHRGAQPVDVEEVRAGPRGDDVGDGPPLREERNRRVVPPVQRLDRLISDMRAIPIMQRFGVPVCFDASHSVQLPGGEKTISGGEREFIPTLTKAALAAGADLIFLESHPDVAHAIATRGHGCSSLRRMRK